MKLLEYIEKNHSGNVSAFALRIGEKAQTVHRWCKKGNIPRPHDMAMLFVETAGAVQANDFYADHIAAARARLKSSTSPLALRAGKGRAA